MVFVGESRSSASLVTSAIVMLARKTVAYSWSTALATIVRGSVETFG